MNADVTIHDPGSTILLTLSRTDAWEILNLIPVKATPRQEHIRGLLQTALKGDVS